MITIMSYLVLQSLMEISCTGYHFFFIFFILDGRQRESFFFFLAQRVSNGDNLHMLSLFFSFFLSQMEQKERAFLFFLAQRKFFIFFSLNSKSALPVLPHARDLHFSFFWQIKVRRSTYHMHHKRRHAPLFLSTTF